MEMWKNTPGRCAEIPQLVYYPAKNKTSDAAIVIFPGGGFVGRSSHEGKGYAEFLNEAGYDAFVCNYRVEPSYYPLPLLDARRAVRWVRYHADEYGIDKNKICVMGSSAGGTISALLSTFKGKLENEGIDEIDNESFVPNGQIICYGYISLCGEGLKLDWANKSLFGEYNSPLESVISPELNVTPETPKAFIWQTAEDDCCVLGHSLTYARALRENNVPVEMHIYPYGGHGLGRAQDDPYLSRWTDCLLAWLKAEFK